MENKLAKNVKDCKESQLWGFLVRKEATNPASIMEMFVLGEFAVGTKG